NAPGRCTVEGVHAPGTPRGAQGVIDRLDSWRPLLASPLQPPTRHVVDGGPRRVRPVGHLRPSVFPGGGRARPRAPGQPAGDPVTGRLGPPTGLARLNAIAPDDARAALRRCCGSTRWAEAMAAARPFDDVAALLRIAERTWWALDEAAHREAFAAHPAIGARG